jgi:orotate phosphoribosyltransferase
MMGSAARQKLIEIVCRTSYEYRDVEFKLASGSTSHHYVDCKRGLSYPQMIELLGDVILDTASDVEFDVAGGLELGAYPIGVAVSLAAYRRGRELRSFVIRKVPKKHGMQKLVEGTVRSGDKVLIVDDVITRGDSIIKAIQSSRDEGFEVVGVVAIVDREQDGGRANIEAQGVWVRAIMTLDELIQTHAAEGQLTAHRH